MVPEGVALLYFLYHTYYLSFVDFDYGYNMMANVSVGELQKMPIYLLQCAFSASDVRSMYGFFETLSQNVSYNLHATCGKSVGILVFYSDLSPMQL